MVFVHASGDRLGERVMSGVVGLSGNVMVDMVGLRGCVKTGRVGMRHGTLSACVMLRCVRLHPASGRSNGQVSNTRWL